MLDYFVYWLNQNSAAVQAIAALISMGATIVLAVLTSKYVRLTKVIADTTAAQHRTLLESRDTGHLSALDAIAAHAARIRAQLDGLDASAPQEYQLRGRPLPSNRDAAELEKLAAAVGKATSVDVLRLQTSIRLIAQLANRIQASGSQQVYTFSPQEIGDYVHARAQAYEAASRLAGEYSVLEVHD